MMSRGNHVDELISASLTGDLTDAERLELPAGELVVATELPVDGALVRDAAAWIRVIPGG